MASGGPSDQQSGDWFWTPRAGLPARVERLGFVWISVKAGVLPIMTTTLFAIRSEIAHRAVKTRKLRAAARKAVQTRKRRAAARKAWDTRRNGAQ